MFGALASGGCSGGSSSANTMDTTGTAGTAGTAGTTTTGTGGDGSGAAGTSGGAGATGGVTGQADGGDGSGGSTGSAGATGTGAGGATGAAGVGGHPTGPSAGCALGAPPDGIGKAVEHDMTVTVAAKYMAGYTSRKYFTTLPTGFDPTKAYPVVFYGQGCGQSGSEGSPFTSAPYTSDFIYVQMIPAAVTGQTVVPSSGAPGCFQAGKEGLADSPDGPYFDQMVSEIEKSYCVDTGQLYVSGWSSGAWMTTFLACTRGGVIRGAASNAGGLQHDYGNCLGGTAIIMVVGNGDTENGIVDTVDGFDVGTGQARDILVKANGCSTTPTSYTDSAYGTCQMYGNCASPVVWCAIGGGHGAGQGDQAKSAWPFWMSLK